MQLSLAEQNSVLKCIEKSCIYCCPLVLVALVSNFTLKVRIIPSFPRPNSATLIYTRGLQASLKPEAPGPHVALLLPLPSASLFKEKKNVFNLTKQFIFLTV